MMPGTNETALLVRPSVAVSELTGGERAVALYVSDMPAGRRRVTGEQVRAWIVQGVERLGQDEVRQRAAFRYGHRLLEMSGLVTAQVQARHEQRFPQLKRLARAEQEAANSVFGDRMTEETLRRNSAAEVDGGCPCRGTRSIPMWMDEDVFVSRACPVHGRATISHHRGGRA
ncbi:hypothetical protein ACFQ71_39800 [Streptomyces sp. NPDC056534]|uniref:hypothetical protein n=1 Tax=Streptomyces sp. NPDC056534 TaxID=3345857 RepID=UPI0036957ECC